MAKTKYIVPVVAMMLCAVSLIGAGYAAYSAKLTDTEEVTADNKYFELKLDTGTAFISNIDLKWDTEKAYSGGVEGDTTWKLQSDTIDLGKFIIAVDNNQTGQAAPTTYTLTPSALSVTGGPTEIDAKLALKVYTDADGPGTEIDPSSLTAGTAYHMVLVVATGFQTTDEPTDNITLGYTLTATANIA